MNRTNYDNSRDGAPPTVGGARLIAERWRRLWAWLTWVDSADPVRHALNRGFAVFILLVAIPSIALIPVFILTGEFSVALTFAAAMFFQLFALLLNRRGTIYGALLYTVWTALAVVIGVPASSYAGRWDPLESTCRHASLSIL